MAKGAEKIVYYNQNSKKNIEVNIFTEEFASSPWLAALLSNELK